MSHAQEINLSVQDTNKNYARCHLMPCTIEHDQLEVKVREYFEPTIRKLKKGDDDEQGRATKQPANEGNTLVASFRGRPLMGEEVKLPEGYVGHVIGRGNSFGRIKEHFSEFAYWNWDEMPNKNDPPVKALNWLRISKSVHDPID